MWKSWKSDYGWILPELRSIVMGKCRFLAKQDTGRSFKTQHLKHQMNWTTEKSNKDLQTDDLVISKQEILLWRFVSTYRKQRFLCGPLPNLTTSLPPKRFCWFSIWQGWWVFHGILKHIFVLSSQLWVKGTIGHLKGELQVKFSLHHSDKFVSSQKFTK